MLWFFWPAQYIKGDFYDSATWIVKVTFLRTETFLHFSPFKVRYLWLCSFAVFVYLVFCTAAHLRSIDGLSMSSIFFSFLSWGGGSFLLTSSQIAKIFHWKKYTRIWGDKSEIWSPPLFPKRTRMMEKKSGFFVATMSRFLLWVSRGHLSHIDLSSSPLSAINSPFSVSGENLANFSHNQSLLYHGLKNEKVFFAAFLRNLSPSFFS